jgi:hypothetical protein
MRWKMLRVSTVSRRMKSSISKESALKRATRSRLESLKCKRTLNTCSSEISACPTWIREANICSCTPTSTSLTLWMLTRTGRQKRGQCCSTLRTSRWSRCFTNNSKTSLSATWLAKQRTTTSCTGSSWTASGPTATRSPWGRRASRPDGPSTF